MKKRNLIIFGLYGYMYYARNSSVLKLNIIKGFNFKIMLAGYYELVNTESKNVNLMNLRI